MKTPSFQPRMHSRRLALGAVEDLADGLEHGLEPVLVHQLEQPPLADAGRAHHGPQVALEVARVPHVGRHHLQHVVAQLARGRRA